MNDFLFGLMIALSVGPVALMIANYGMRAGSLAGQLVFAFGGSVIGRIVKSPGLLAASHVVAALVVLGYGMAGLARL